MRSLGCIFIQNEIEMKIETQGQCHMIENQIKVMWLQVKEHQGMMSNTRSYEEARKDYTWNLQRKHGPVLIWDSWHLELGDQ